MHHLAPARRERAVVAELDPGDLAALLLGQRPDAARTSRTAACAAPGSRRRRYAVGCPSRRGGAGTTTTGMCAWRVHWSLTEPSTSPMKPPWPRAPTTSRSASADWSSSTCVLPPSIASRAHVDAGRGRRGLLARRLADARRDRLRGLERGLDADVARRVPGRRVGGEPGRPGVDHVQLDAAQRGLARRPGDRGAGAACEPSVPTTMRPIAALQSSCRGTSSRAARHRAAGPARARVRTPGMNRRELLIAAAAAPAALAAAAPAAARRRARRHAARARDRRQRGSRARRPAHRHARRALARRCPIEPHGIEAVDLLRSALVLSYEPRAPSRCSMRPCRACAPCSRASRRRATRPAIRAGATPTSATTPPARSSRSTCRARE